MLKTTARFFLPIFAVWAVMLPVRVYAFAPLVISAARITGTYLTTPAGQKAMGSLIGLTLGTAISQILVNRNDGTNNRDDVFYTTNTPRSPSATEAAAGFTAGSPSVVPPSTASHSFLYSLNASPPAIYSSVDLACAARMASVGGHHYTTSGGGGVTPACTVYNAGGGIIASGSLYWTDACPSGYVAAAGNTCALSVPAAVVRPVDNVCPFVRSGNTYSGDPYDPDCATGQNPTFTAPSAGVSHWDWTDYRGWHQEVTISADGTMQLTQWVPDTATNTTKKQVIAATAPASGNPADPPLVSGISDSVLSGTGTQVGGTVIPPTTSPTTDAAIAAQTVAINELKAEVAATGEANTVLTPSVAAAAAVQAQMAAAAQGVTDRASGLGLPALPGFLLPVFNSGACVPIGWTFQGRSVSFDLCPYVSTIKSISAWVLNLIGAALAFSMLMNFRAMRLRA